MCTVSWAARRGGYDLFFNRDEVDTRAPESAPEVAQRDGVAFIAPRDGKHDGTWLLANEFGLTVCLLNDYGSAWRPSVALPRFSRGHVVTACAAARDHDAVIAAASALPLVATPAFQLVALAPDEPPLSLHWQGTLLVRKPAAAAVPPISSSSFATDDVIAQRVRRFRAFVREQGRARPEELAAYHRQHDANAGAHSVLMRRPDAATRSVIRVAVDASGVEVAYQPVGWDVAGPVMAAPMALRLERRVVR